ncbi:MAG: anaerobic ribonucleoside-triphosphate reductase activating protein [Vulcanimicrobiota bacterium]
MEIGGFQKLSVNNFPGKVAAVVFTQGCNFHCYYCHNKKLISQKHGSVPEQEVLNYLEENNIFLEGVVITGGEPTIQKGLETFITLIKDMGLEVKLDTNGFLPEKVKSLLDQNLLDYVALDIKAKPEEYDKLTGQKNSWVKIEKTLKYLRESDISYELRTTSKLKPDWIKKIVLPEEKWFWQPEQNGCNKGGIF